MSHTIPIRKFLADDTALKKAVRNRVRIERMHVRDTYPAIVIGSLGDDTVMTYSGEPGLHMGVIEISTMSEDYLEAARVASLCRDRMMTLDGKTAVVMTIDGVSYHLGKAAHLTRQEEEGVVQDGSDTVVRRIADQWRVAWADITAP
jgi:hypothetical protein